MKVLFILLALTSPAFAQSGCDYLLDDFKNLEVLYSNLRAENAQLKKALADAQQKSTSSPPDGSSSSRPEVRQEGGGASGSR